MSQMERFNITKRVKGNGSIILDLSGRIDALKSNMLQKHIKEALEDGASELRLDMSCVAFLGSAGIRVLLTAYKKAVGLGVSFSVENPSSNVKNVLGMTALDKMLLRE